MRPSMIELWVSESFYGGYRKEEFISIGHWNIPSSDLLSAEGILPEGSSVSKNK